MAYWIDRVNAQANVLFEHTAMETDAQVAKYYQQALASVERDLSALYDKLLEEGLDTNRTIDLYRYRRFYELRGNIQDQLTRLGLKERKTLDKSFVDMYNGVQGILTKNGPTRIAVSFLPDGKALDVVNSVWCADGKHWSDRVWGNKAKLQATIEKTLIDCVVAGKPKSYAIKELKANFGVSFNEADRLVRTELNYIQNQSAADRYIAAGVHEYEILATEDSRTSEICKEQDKKVYSFADKVVGVNFPPFHPHCRSTIIPVIEE